VLKFTLKFVLKYKIMQEKWRGNRKGQTVPVEDYVSFTVK